MILGLLSITGHNANVYLLNTFALSYITTTLALPQSVAITALLSAACVGVVTVLLFGHLADRVGRRPVFMAARPSSRCSPSPSSGCWRPARHR